MNLEEVPPVIDVHPPHEPIHGWRDFLLHLATITIGLLIALGLEGCVEWQHHRHLVHEAEASLRAEITSNESTLQSVLADVHKQQKTLKQDVILLDQMIKDPKAQIHQQMSLSYRLVGFDDVSWKTAQNTGALAYMPYTRAQEYAGIYSLQDELDTARSKAFATRSSASVSFSTQTTPIQPGLPYRTRPENSVLRLSRDSSC